VNTESAKEYALALFELALEKDQLEDIKVELTTITSLLKENVKFYDILHDPRLRQENKKEVLTSVCQGLNSTLLHFFYVLIDNHTFSGLELITNEFIDLYNQYNEILHITAITTIPLTEKEINKLIIELTKRYHRRVEIENVIDKTILGGIKLIVGNEVIDYSIKNQINDLKRSILRNT